MYQRNKIIHLIVVLIMCGIIIHLINKKSTRDVRVVYDPPPRPEPEEMQAAESNISCHYLVKGDVLPSAEDSNFNPGHNSIFFHETSCHRNLNSRQACAIESAARAHIDRQVYVMFSAPISKDVYNKGCFAKLQEFPNIKFARVHIEEYAKYTPVETMIANGSLKESNWQVEHTSDVLRFLTLFKWGGIYLDTDMLVVKSLVSLGGNWVARESNELVNAAAMAISIDEIGRSVIAAVINEIRTNFRPDIWIHNGPGAITRVLKKRCTSQNLTEWSNNTCYGFNVYPPGFIYPLHYSRKDEYFKAGDLKDVDNAYTHHLWNKLTFDMTLEMDSPYKKMAKQFCPTIYEMYGDDFGNK